MPLKQAVRLPIWIYNPHFIRLKGKIRIESDTIHPCMIKLGFLGGRMFPNNGIQITHDGEIVFKGKCLIGNNSFIVTGKQGRIEFGSEFIASSSTKIISMCGITFGKEVVVGWDTVFEDSNFHPLYDRTNGVLKKAYVKIFIGDNNWISSQCFVMHSVQTPHRVIFGARTLVTRSNQYQPYCVYGGSPIRELVNNVEL